MNRENKETLAQKILALLGVGPAIKGREIAAKLGVDHTDVNHELYNSLKGQVHKDAAFRWSLAPGAQTPQRPAAQAPPPAAAEVAAAGAVQPPDCPECGRPMRLRTARVGPNRGNTFWGCSAFPECQGTRSQGARSSSEQAGEVVDGTSALAGSIEWRESKARVRWTAEYLPVASGSALFADVVGSHPVATRLLSQTALFRSRGRIADRPDDQTLGLLAVAEKILLRGRLPLPCLSVEREALRANELLDRVEDVGLEGSELGWVWRGAPAPWSEEALLDRAEFIGCDELAAGSGLEGALLDSEYEARFVELVATIDESLPHWLMPQVPIENLVADPGESIADDRRVDFVFCHPRLPVVLVLEIDGPEHDAAVDSVRDGVLRAAGYEVIRVPNSEVDAARGAALERALGQIRTVVRAIGDRATPQWQAGRFSLECAWGAKLQLAVVRAIQEGLLPSAADQWWLRIETPFTSSHAAVGDLLALFEAIEQLYGRYVLPAEVLVEGHAGQRARFRRSNGQWTREALESGTEGATPDVVIRLEPEAGPWAAYPERPVDILVRPAYAPREFAASHASGSRARLTTAVDLEIARYYLRELLRAIFRKQEFREGQAEAIHNALRGTDSVVLLPTGGGKSIIYQLAGLLTPGITLVVDPLVSLIEDQVRGLKVYGIDRAVGISSATGPADEKRRLQRAAERGEFFFILVSPERLQSPTFRETLRTIAHSTRINLAVIDEAHCVSEWGHDFRPAYLNLARNLRRLGKAEGHQPTILALTGTASRAVLRDMVADLELDSQTKSSIVRPRSFDRKELVFRIVETDGRSANADLRGVLIALPREFRSSPGDFFNPAGRHTFSGVVFTSFVRPRQGGVVDLRDQIKAATGAGVTIYSGSSPWPGNGPRSWDEEKRDNARRFMKNEVPVLVATKAFGMGIDKPNIRYTIHYGMPGSLEAFYQEAGRAGRDRRTAQCIVLFAKPEPQIEASLDVIRKSLSELQVAFASAPRDGRGDLGGALFFHLNAFKGAEDEVQAVRVMLTRLRGILPGQSHPISFATDSDKRKEDEARKLAEKSLFRLVQVGFLADYEVDYGSKKYRVEGGSNEPQAVADRVVAYVRRSNVGRVEDVQRQLAPLKRREASPETTLEIIRVLIEYCYDTIERARRRSIFEAMEAAKQGRDPANFRRRLLDYLQEGMDPDSFQQLVEMESIDFSVCAEKLSKVNNAAEAGELRGITIRFLESYPEHPVLLALRALSESLSEDCDDAVVLDSLRNLFGSSLDKYSVDRAASDGVIEIIARTAETRAMRLFPALLLALEDSGYLPRSRGVSMKALEERGLKSAADEVQDVLLVRRLRITVEQLRVAVADTNLRRSYA